MATFLKQSTAVTVKIGPFLDSTDGVTAETALTISQADVRLSKNGGNMAQKNESTSATHDEIGWYDCPLDTTDTGTLGILTLMVAEAGALPVWHEFMVLADNVYDSLVGGGDTLQVDVTSIAANVITATAINNDAFTAAKFAADVTTELQSGLATAAALATVDGIVDDILVDTGTTLPAQIDVIDNFLDTEVAAILAGVNTLLAGLVVASGTIGDTGNSTTALHLEGLTYGDDEINNYLLVVRDVSASEYHARWIEDFAGATDVATVATLPFTPENDVDTYTLLPIRQDVTGGSGLDAAGVRAAVGLASANLDTQLSTIDSNVDSILEDTGTTLQGELDGIQADTEDIQGRLPAALVSGRMDSNMQAAANGVITAAVIATDAIDSDAIAANAVTEIQNGLATESNLNTVAGYIDTEITTLLNRIGLFTGSGVNTVLGFFQALMRSDSTTPSDLGGSYDDATDSLQAIRDRGDSAWTTAVGFATHTAADVWAVATRLLTAGTNIVLAKGTGVTGFNDLSAAQVNAEADTALADYDPPTHAELVSEVNAVQSDIAGLSIPSASAIATAVWAAADRQLTAISATLRNSIADNILRRSLATAIGSSEGDTLGGRSLIGAIARLVNRSRISGGTLTVYRTDDSTSLFTQTLTTDGAAEPVIEADTD